MKKKNRNTLKPPSLTIVLRILVAGVVIALVAGLLLFTRTILSVKVVECHLISDQACSPELQQSLNVLNGKSMLFEDYESLLNNSLTTQQPFTLVSLEKKVPNTVVVTFMLEPAKYVVIEPSLTSVVSETGKAFTGEYDTARLLQIESDQNIITENGYIPSNIHHTISTILSTSKELELPISKVHWVDNSTIKISMENRQEEFILDSESPRKQLFTASLVLKSGEYREITETKSELDLRFNMPVLRTQP